MLYSLIHHITCRLEARQALVYQLVSGLTGENGEYNYSKAVHLYPPFFDIFCSPKNYKIASALTEILRLDRRQCIALFQGRKPALLYKLTPEELPGYGELKSCRVADYTPEWRLKEEHKKAQTAKKAAPPDVSGQEPPAPPKKPEQEDEPNPSQGLEYQLTDQDKGLGMVELGSDGVVGGSDEDEESPPGR